MERSLLLDAAFLAAGVAMICFIVAEMLGRLVFGG
jgi:hypothetical protein